MPLWVVTFEGGSVLRVRSDSEAEARAHAGGVGKIRTVEMEKKHPPSAPPPNPLSLQPARWPSKPDSSVPSKAKKGGFFRKE